MTGRQAKPITVEISIDPELKDAAEIAAAEDRRSLENLIEKVLADHLMEHGYLTSKRSQPTNIEHENSADKADGYRGWGKLIKDARKSAGLSQEQVAAHVGVTKGTISQWETEQGKPKRKHVPKLASILAIDRGELERLLIE